MYLIKSMGPDEINPKILKYFSTNESFIIKTSQLFEKYIEYEVIWKTRIVITPHKKVWYI